MTETNLAEAFASYKVRPTRRMRSAVTQEGGLVMSCWYGGFKKSQADVLRYEEDLSGQTSEIATGLRTHLAEALSNECEVRVIVAVEALIPKADPAVVAPARTTYYARKDLVGRVTSFDGERFVVEFRRARTPLEQKLPKAAQRARQMG